MDKVKKPSNLVIHKKSSYIPEINVNKLQRAILKDSMLVFLSSRFLHFLLCC
jgi:hypothetical protein